MKHLFIVNPAAGITNKTDEIKKKIAKILKASEYEIYVTKKQGDGEEYVRKTLKDSSEIVRIYACGGDGTLNEVVNGAFGFSNAEVACYPIGSGNDFLRYFGHPIKFMDLEKLINGYIVKSDLIKYNDRYCINVFNIGFDGGVAHRQKKIKRIPLVSGKMAYNLSVVISVLGRISNKVKLTVDGEEIFSGKCILAALANGSCYGGGYNCAPKADINDGLIDIVLIKKMSLFKFAQLIKSYKNGTYLENKKAEGYIFYLKGKNIELEVCRKTYYSNDGEIGENDKYNLSIIDSAMNFVLPQDI